MKATKDNIALAYIGIVGGAYLLFNGMFFKNMWDRKNAESFEAEIQGCCLCGDSTDLVGCENRKCDELICKACIIDPSEEVLCPSCAYSAESFGADAGKLASTFIYPQQGCPQCQSINEYWLYEGDPKKEANSIENGYHMRCNNCGFKERYQTPDIDYDTHCEKLLEYALADLEGIMPEFEPSGDRSHPAWQTIVLLKNYLKDSALSDYQSETFEAKSKRKKFLSVPPATPLMHELEKQGKTLIRLDYYRVISGGWNDRATNQTIVKISKEMKGTLNKIIKEYGPEE